MRYTLLLILLFSLTRTNGQSPASDSSSLLQAIGKYHRFTGGQAYIYNGIEFIAYDPSIKGHAFFISDTLDKTSIVYDGILYEHIPALYDIIKDKLVISDGNGNLICPNPVKIERFYLRGHEFINTSKGYYDVLCSGTLGVQARRTKQIDERVSVQEYTRTANERDHFFMVKDGVYYPIGNVFGLLAQMGDRRKTVRQYLRKNKIKPRRDKELAIVKAAEYYNQLPH